MDETKFDMAILLIYAATKAIRSRRGVEQMLAYPEEWGEDRVVLEKMEEFLNYPDMKERVLELTKNMN